MDRLYFEDIEELVTDIDDVLREFYDAECEDIFSVSIIAKYEEAKRIIHNLIHIGYSVESIQLHPYEVNNYSDEYVIDLNWVDEKNIWCQEMKYEDKYVDIESDIIYVLDNCSSKALNHCKSDCAYEVSIGENEEENNDDADVHGFSLSHTDDNGYHSFSYYTTNSLSEKDIREMVDKLGFSFSK